MTRSMRRRWIALAVQMVVATLAMADEGRIPLHEPTTVTQPGRYVVTAGFSGSIALTISASNVHVDLDGKTLGGAGGPAISIQPGATNLTIENGILTGGTSGIQLTGASSANNLTLRNLQIRSTSSHAVQLFGDLGNVQIENLRISGAGGSGILLSPSTTSFVGRIESCTTIATASYGIYVNPALGNLEIRDNVIQNFGTGAAAAGILATGSCLVIDNVVARGGADDAGIRLGVDAWGAIARGNVVVNCGSDGIQSFGNYQTLQENQVSANGGCGLNITQATVVYKGNVLHGNTGGAVCGGSGVNGGGNLP